MIAMNMNELRQILDKFDKIQMINRKTTLLVYFKGFSQKRFSLHLGYLYNFQIIINIYKNTFRIIIIIEMQKFRLFNDKFDVQKDQLFPKRKEKSIPAKSKPNTGMIIIFPQFFQKSIPDSFNNFELPDTKGSAIVKKRAEFQKNTQSISNPYRNISTAIKVQRQLINQQLYMPNQEILPGFRRREGNKILKSIQINKTKQIRCHSEHNQQQNEILTALQKTSVLSKTNKNLIHKNEMIPKKSNEEITLLYDFLFAINYYNGVIYEKTLNPKATITKGNNGNLIKEILKKRYWWIIKQEGQINFLWSQKQKKSFPTQRSYGFSKILPKSQVKSLVLRSPKLAKLMIHQNNLIYKDQQPAFFPNKIQLTQKLYNRQGSEPKIHNHLPEASSISTKKGLYLSLLNFYKKKNKNIFQVVPLTFLFHESPFSNTDSLLNLIKYQQEKGQKLWIVKPGQDFNRGNGILITQSIDEIKQVIKGRKKQKSFIVQKYLSPFLYSGRKFDIRCYLLITIVDSKTKAYWYQDGYIRTSSFVFSECQKSPLIHLTNDAIQKTHADYGKFQGSNKITYEQFQNYLNQFEIEKEYNFSNVIKKMKQIAADLVEATFFNYNPQKLDISFQLFGLDFMIDQNFDVFLIEANSNPCLEVSGQVLKNIIPNLIDNVFRIALDPIFLPTQGKRNVMKQNAYQTNKFSIIFDQRYY